MTSDSAPVRPDSSPPRGKELPKGKELQVVVITGLSGAGKSTALHTLEDLGYFCIDNLPPPVFIQTIDALKGAGNQRIAVCMDIRARVYLSQIADVLREVRARPELLVDILYLDAPSELLARRYSATRRPHPLSRQSKTEVRAVMAGIALEAELLAPLRALASFLLDTGGLTVHDLRREVIKIFSLAHPHSAPQMFVRVVSFGFKYGVPQDADMMFDVRFLPNPYFVPGLRALSGQSPEVSAFVLASEGCRPFLGHVLDLLGFCVPQFESEGKSYLTIAVGCTGGRHRSVALSETIARELESRLGIAVDRMHRDLGRAEHLDVDAQASEIGTPSC